jgi:hypothetical protein
MSPGRAAVEQRGYETRFWAAARWTHLRVSGDVINDRDGVFRGVSPEFLLVNAVTELVRGQLRVSRKLEEWVQKNF